MYSTCTFCHAPLGKNEALEHFQVGRKLAFDAKRGRLWVVCIVCKQWNLSPLETRWEGIEDAERAYRATRLRAATDQIGLAKLRDGTELIRIGEPLRPEFAAWRYGERFAARWQFKGRAAAVGSGALALAAKGFKFNILFSLGAVPFGIVASTVAAAEFIRRRAMSAVVRLPGHEPAWFSQAHVQSMRFEPAPKHADGWQLRVQYKPWRLDSRFFRKSDPEVLLRGEQAQHVARQLLPRLNRGGGPKQTVASAVDILHRHGDVNSILRFVSRVTVDDEPRKSRKRWAWDRDDDGRAATSDDTPPILRAAAELRLAAEMAVHEELERRALEGDLAALEAEWKEAEEIAAIADNLVTSPGVLRALETLRLR